MQQDMTITEAIDITGLSFQQLDQLRTRVEQRVTEKRETGAPALREQWTEQAAAIGMTIDEILEGAKAKRARPRASRNTESE